MAILQRDLQAEHDHPDGASLTNRVFLAAKQQPKALHYAQQIYQSSYNPAIHQALAQCYAAWQSITLPSKNPPVSARLSPRQTYHTRQRNGKAAQQTLTLISGKSLFACLQCASVS